MKKKQIAVIIGAGPGGLTTAYQLLKNTKDIHPIILEAGDYLGGIARTINHNQNRMDIGGHRFFSKEERVMSLWREIMPLQGAPSKDDLATGRKPPLAKNGPDPEKTNIVMLMRRRISRIFYLRKFFDYPLSIKLETFANLGLIRTIRAGVGYLMAALFKRKENSLEDFLINRFGKPLYEMFFEDYTEKVWGVSPKLISPSWGAQRIKGLSLMKALKTILFKPFNKNKKKIETSLIEEFYYPKYGPGHMYEHMCELIKNMGGEVRLNHRVVKINLKGSRVESVIVSTPEGNQELKGDYFVSTMPIKDLVGAMKETMTKPEILPLADGLIYRDFITVGVLVPKLKIKNKTKIKTLGDVVPDCWIYIQEKDVKVGRLQVFNNWSPYMVKDPEHTVWVGMEYFVNVGDTLWEMKEDKFRQFAIQELVKIGILDESTHVLDSVQVKVEKAYPAYFGTYDRFEEIRQYLDSVKNLYCIGRNGQHRYNNMDHSMMTAIVTVESILDPEKILKSSIWNVNTEKEYHESKKVR